MEAATKVRSDLFSGGYDEADCRLVTGEQVVPAAREQLGEAVWLARLRKSDEFIKAHLEAAKRGNAFLLVFAPTDPEAERVMNVIRRGPFEFVHRYHRFSIQTMK
jgi:hypothetical protein